jgi:hypothetical protein
MILAEILGGNIFYDFADTRVRILFIISGRIKKFYVRGRNKIGLVMARGYEPCRI